MVARASLGPPRRTEGKRNQGRSAEVVQRVLTATAEEVGRVGLAALRVEDVATRSGVNKTTIYRRWPTKAELITAMLESGYEEPHDFDRGSLAEDLRACLYDLRERLLSASKRGVLQVLQAERANPEVAALVRRLRARNGEVRRRLFERAIARGELPADTNSAALVKIAAAPIVARLVHLGRPVEDEFIELIADLICKGAAART